MSNPQDKLRILLVAESSIELSSFLQLPFEALIRLLDYADLGSYEYISLNLRSFPNDISQLAYEYSKYDLVLFIGKSLKLEINICRFINKKYLQITWNI